MPSFGKRSKERLATCDPRLQKVLNEVIKHIDCSILEGHRNEERQNELYDQGKSKLRYPSGKHNSLPAKAVDVVPYFKNAPHIRWDDGDAFYYFAGLVVGIGATMGIKIRWGGNWDMDDEFQDQSFFDLPHFEIKD